MKSGFDIIVMIFTIIYMIVGAMVVSCASDIKHALLYMFIFIIGAPLFGVLLYFIKCLYDKVMNFHK